MSELGLLTGTFGTLRKIPEDKKMCPLTLAAGNDEDPAFYICAEKRCAWFMKEFGECSAHAIASWALRAHHKLRRLE